MLERLYAGEKQKPAMSKEHFELLSRLREALDQRREVLKTRQRQMGMLHFEHSGPVKSYNALAARVEALEAEAERKEAERERLEEAVRQVRAELAGVPFESGRVGERDVPGTGWIPDPQRLTEAPDRVKKTLV